MATERFEPIQEPVSLRDRFAMQAMNQLSIPMSYLHDTQAAYDRAAAHCWKMADAMLRMRDGRDYQAAVKDAAS